MNASPGTSRSALSVLRPLSLGQLLDRAIRLYRRNFLKFLGIIAIVQIPVTLLQIVSTTLTTSNILEMARVPATQATRDSAYLNLCGGLLGVFLISIAGFILIQVVGAAALTRAVADSLLGKASSILGSFRKIGASWLQLLGAYLLVMLIGAGLVIWTVVPCAGWLTGPSMFVVLSGMILPLVVPVVVLEGKSTSQALRRAWDLARRRFWWVLGFVFILYLFSMLVVSGPAALLNVLVSSGSRIGEAAAFNVMGTVLQSLVTMLFSLLYLPLQLTAFTLVYLDLRVRTEGLDLALQASEFDSESAQPSEIDLPGLLAQAPPAETGQLVTSTEFGYFILLSILAIVVYAIFIGLFMGLVSLGSLL
ncbi:MAG: glycerophosphoryl diester phosphodiesterase membrane domain-containing protein [Chloroflexota bacterium]